MVVAVTNVVFVVTVVVFVVNIVILSSEAVVFVVSVISSDDVSPSVYRSIS